MFVGVYFCDLNNVKGGRENLQINPSQTLMNLQYSIILQAKVYQEIYI